MANNEFLNKGIHLKTNAWTELHAPSSKQSAGIVTVVPVNDNLTVKFSIRIKHATNDYKVLARKFSVVSGGGYAETIKLTSGKAVEVLLHDTLATASVSGVSLANPLVVTVDAVPSEVVVGSYVSFTGIVGTTELNDSNRARWRVNALTGTTVTLGHESTEANVDGTSGFTAYTSGGTMTVHRLDATYDYYEESIPA